MKMRRIHAIQVAREQQRIENQERRDAKKKKAKRRSIISKWLGIKE
jgi:hypothetical protein